jgi:hypothetical protein
VPCKSTLMMNGQITEKLGSGPWLDAERAQRDLLFERIIRPNANCEYGRKHNFASVRSVNDFRNAVPVCTYEDLRGDIKRMLEGDQGVLVTEPVRRFFLTSGSTAASKYVPVTNSFIRDKWRALQRYWALLRRDHAVEPGGPVIANFSDGSREDTTAGGAPCCSESSFWATFGHADRTARPALPRAVLNIQDPEARYYTIARILLETKVAVLMALNPSTLVRLFDVINQYADLLIEDLRRGGLSQKFAVPAAVREYMACCYGPNETRARELAPELATAEPKRCSASRLWPSLRATVCWRSLAVRPYLELLEPSLRGVPKRDYITMASEGVIAIPFQDDVSGGALAVDSHFLEFIPEDAAAGDSRAAVLAHELEPGRNYVVVLSTSAGLYRYNIGDVVRVREFTARTPVVEFLYRTGQTSSLTGEKLTEAQVANAVHEAAAHAGVRFDGFTMCPVAQPFPHYALVAELHPGSQRTPLAHFLLDVEQTLRRDNIEYRSKRNSRRLGSPELWLVAPRSYERLRGRRVAAGVSDSQVKVSALTRDLEWHRQFEIVEKFACESERECVEDRRGAIA